MVFATPAMVMATVFVALPAQKRGVGFVFQRYAAFKHISVAKNVAFGLEIRRRPRAEVARRVDELLRLVGTPDELYDARTTS